MNPFETAKAQFNRAMAHLQKEEWEEAEVWLRNSLQLVPDRPSILNNLSAVLLKLKKFDEAEELVGKALSIDQNMAAAWANRAALFSQLKRYQEALQSCDRALQLKPDYAEACLCRGTILNDLKQHSAALASFDRAIELKPDFAEAHNNRGNTLHDLGRMDEALASYEQALKLKPDYEYLYGNRLHAKIILCDWADMESQVSSLFAKIQRSEKVIPPFPVLALTDSSQLQRKAAEIWANDKHPASHDLAPIPRHARRGKLRIGYYSADFHDHATAYLTAELFELHDRDQFELVAFSMGPDRNDQMRKRLAAAFESFIDVRDKADRDVALLSRDMEIDIAVDLKGFTQDSRVGIFAHRAAPIQVSYLGYPGTMGTDYIDYLIADGTLIPEPNQRHYSEKIVYLPNSYQVNDRQRAIANGTFAREALGLPRTGFVFCCFNSNYKITPATFEGWMRILRRVEGSVLWLLEDYRSAANNLRTEAAKKNVDPGRLVFARRVPYAEHLARHRAADLFVDTLPCNAHTTASDALWAGLPVLTCQGEAFASRVAASLLNAICLPELITATQEGYESLAVELATDSERLKKIKQKLDENRLTTPLFDTPSFTRHLEHAYRQMDERYQADLRPDHIYARS
jgi:predicted O-linked N-acetylglucosamine transferase (SPINDLY family)